MNMGFVEKENDFHAYWVFYNRGNYKKKKPFNYKKESSIHVEIDGKRQSLSSASFIFE